MIQKIGFNFAQPVTCLLLQCALEMCTTILCKHMHYALLLISLKAMNPRTLKPGKQYLDVVNMKNPANLHASLDGICWLCRNRCQQSGCASRYQEACCWRLMAHHVSALRVEKWSHLMDTVGHDME